MARKLKASGLRYQAADGLGFAESAGFSMPQRELIMQRTEDEKSPSSLVPVWPNAGSPGMRNIEPSDPVYRLSELAQDLGGNMDSRKLDEIVYQLQGAFAL